MDHSRHWQICRLFEPYFGQLQGPVELGAFERCFRVQHVRLSIEKCRAMNADSQNSFIVIGSSNEMARKILNSPNHAEPCLVASAKKVLLPENWVFLHGKVHADYRKALNVLFTKQALR